MNHWIIAGAAIIFAIALLLIVREVTRGRAAPQSVGGEGERPSSVPPLAMEDPDDAVSDDADITKVASSAAIKATLEGAPAAKPGLPTLGAAGPEGEDSGDSYSSQSAVTVFDDDGPIDEPTGKISFFVVHGVAQTDTGKKRRRNEDSYLAMPAAGIFVVADGMGGYGGGDVASRLAVEAIRDTFEGNQFHKNEQSKRPRRGEELVQSIEEANQRILRTAQEKEEYEGMGTTVVAARFSSRKNKVFIAHVGDSRCYRVRQGQMVLLTADHTLGAKGVVGPLAGHLRRAVGIREQVKVDLRIETPIPGDTYLLCSDGLSKMVDDAAVQEILLAHRDANEAAHALVEAANEAGGKDNVTVIVLRVAAPGMGAPA